MSFMLKGDSFGQRRPPLYHLIKDILREYPSGQVFKEIIQNADDAGATEVKFYLDRRNLQTLPRDLVTSNVYNELDRFQGPALMAYNNAPFLEEDWEGIQNLQQSGKAENPHKVGKFGIGFNSVYHITDLPVIISEQRCGFLEPQEEIWQGSPGTKFDLKTLHTGCPKALLPYREVEGFSLPLNGKTLFRFPLRNKPSKLSTKVCTVASILSLLNALKAEAKYLLLFLRSICSIEVVELLQSSTSKSIFRVCVSPHDYVKHHAQQRSLIERIKSSFSHGHHQYSNVIFEKSQFEIEVSDGSNMSKQHRWMVIHRVGSEDRDVLELAKEQYVLPWVGTAYEIGHIIGDSGGRIYCFLPLPTEDRAPFSINVNGTFAVSSNRRSLNWESQERQGDNEGRWNRFLVEKCLPHCYHQLIQELVKISSISPHIVYKCWPAMHHVKGTPWERMMEPLFTEMLSSTNKIVYTGALNGQWISLNEAILIPDNMDLPESLKIMLISNGIKLVSLPSTQHSILSKYYRHNLTLVSASFVRDTLKKNRGMYCNLHLNEKLDILEFCLTDGNYADLAGLELIPLANGQFGQFQYRQRSRQTVYVCSTSIRHDLLPGLDHIMVDIINHNTCNNFHSMFEAIAQNGKTQLQCLGVSEVVRLISESLSNPKNWSQIQLQKFWEWLQRYDLRHFCNLPLLPVQDVHGVVQIYNLSKKSNVVYVTSQMNKKLRKCLERCGGHFACISEFNFLIHRNLSSLLYSFEVGDVVDALADPYSISRVSFNHEESLELKKFLESTKPSVWNAKRIEKIEAMAIFPTVQQENKLYSINSVRGADHMALVQGDEYSYNTQLIPNDPAILKGERLLRILPIASGVKFISGIQYLEDIAFPIIQARRFPERNLSDFMISVLGSLRTLSRQYPKEINSLLKNLSSLPFVSVAGSAGRKSPSSLFDPDSKILLQLYKGEPVFPIGHFKDQIQELRKCGLRDCKSITGDMLYHSVIACNLPPRNATSFIRMVALFEFLEMYPTKVNETISGTGLCLFRVVSETAKTRAVLPVVAERPTSYPPSLTWKGSSRMKSLVKFDPGEVIVLPGSVNHTKSTYIDPRIIGSQVVYVHNIPKKICQQLLPTSRNRLAASVVKHFKHVLENEIDIEPETLQEISCLTYDYINSVSQCQVNLERDEEWVWIEKCGTFFKPSVCALDYNDALNNTVLEPFIYVLPRKMKKYEHFLCRHGVQQTVTNNQIVSVLQSIKSNPTSIDPKQAWSLVKSILDWTVFTSTCDSSNDILVPIQKPSNDTNLTTYPNLYPVDEVSYTDNEVLLEIAQSSDEEYTLVHPSVSHLAPQLGLKPLSDQLDITEDVFEDAGQHEPLTTRLSNILKEYKDGITIIKEMIQNADDAEASEVNILYDSRHHSEEKLLFKGMGDSHGPALVVHNNAKFTKDDFNNITKLAGATKKGKPLKIGKFGVGFCSVYHITDVPSFVSGEWLYIFDPTLSHLKGVVKNENQPGKKVKYMSKFIAKTKQLTPYQGLFEFDSRRQYNGTMFRFPFRKHASQISPTIYNDGMVRQLKEDLLKEGASLLLFLTHVRTIRFQSIRNGQNTPSEEIIVTKTATPDNLLKIDTVNCHTKNRSTQHWLVSTYQDEQYHIHDKVSQPAVSSVACQLHETSNGQYEVIPVDGLVFCYLPLSVPSTGLPVHVSANFAVMSNRSGIWASNSSNTPSDSREWWNQQLMTTVIPTAYCRLLNMLKSLQQEHKLVKYIFHVLFPLLKNLSIRYPWEIMIKTITTNLVNEELFYSRFSDVWIELKECQFLSQSILSIHTKRVPKCVIDSLLIMKLPVVDIPHEYLNQIQSIVSSDFKMFDQTMFCLTFMNMIDMFIEDHETRNEVLLNMFITAASELTATQESELIEILQVNPCIPVVPNGLQIKRVSEVIDSKSNLKELFEEDDEVFAVKTFTEREPVHRLMIDIGLLRACLPWDMVLECAKSIQALYKSDKRKALRRVFILIKVMEENIENGSSDQTSPSITELKETAFIPVAGKPEGYFLQWKGEEMELASPSCQLFHPSDSKSFHARSKSIKKDCFLLGSQKVMINNLPISKNGCEEIPESVLKFLGIQKKPSFEDVLANYECLISTYQQLDVEADESVIKAIDYTCRITLEFMNEEMHVPYFPKSIGVPEVVKAAIAERKSKLSKFSCQPFIWSGADFICPENISQKWKEKGPRLYEIPSILATRKELIEALGIKEQFSIEKLLDTLKEVYDEFGEEELPKDYRALIDAIISEFNYQNEVNLPEYCEEKEIFLPSSSYVVYSSKKLSINDTPWLPADESCILVHKTLNREIALAMNVKSVCSQFLEKYHTSTTRFGGVSFGQREQLTQRIKNIIRDYPLDVTLLKELLQNADDAKATKMCVILDKRTHGRERLPSEEWSDLQGPALLVWNNEEFTEEDIEGIQKLGLGSKRDDFESIGQFGIGFNVVYHLTDCPSFISGGKTLCVFDPHCKYVPGASLCDPGRRYDNIGSKFWDAMSDIKDAYLQGKTLTDQPDGLQNGALFRFPLRSTKSHIIESEIIEDKIMTPPLTPDVLEKDLDEWIPQIKEALLFLNNVVEFSYYVIEESHPRFELRSKCTVKLDEDAIQTRSDLLVSVRKFQKKRVPDVITYQIKMDCSEARRQALYFRRHEPLMNNTCEEWLIQQGIGDFDKRPTDQKWHFVEQVLPKHGLAVPLNKVCSFGHGKLFCFLPLPGVSGLPIHVNGQFVLNSNRRSLWAGNNDGEDKKKEWNDSLIEAIASSYVQFLEEARAVFVENKDYENKEKFYECINQFYQLLPIWRSPSTKENQRELVLEKNCFNLAQLVFKKLWERNSEILAVEIFTKQEASKSSLVRVEWNCLNNEKDCFKQVYFPPSCDDKVERKAVIALLRLIQMKLTCASYNILKHFLSVDVEPVIATPESVFNFFCNFHDRIFMDVCCPCSISKTPFKTAEKFLKFVLYLLSINDNQELEFPESPFNQPFLLTADEHLRFFDENVKVMRTYHFKLFQNSLSSFQHGKFLSTPMCSSYFIKMTEFNEINGLLADNYSRELNINKSCDNSDNSLITADNLTSLWQGLLCNTDKFLFNHLSDILQSWALIPATNGWLYSTDNEVIPMAEPFGQGYFAKEAFQVLEKIGFPVLDTSYFPHQLIPDAIKSLIPTISDHDRILSMLCHMHTIQHVLDDVSLTKDWEKILLEYFSKTSFSRNQKTKSKIMSLPLFKTVAGCLTDLKDKQVYRWPCRHFCDAGFDKWGYNDDTAITFLEYSGDWRKLTSDFSIIGKELNEREVYSKLIFPVFIELSSDERNKHLKYIKNVMYHSIKYDVERVKSRYITSDDDYVKCSEAKAFLNTMKTLRCVPCSETDQLKTIKEFCDHRVEIFQYFPQEFDFLPKEYHDDTWVEFFQTIGLQMKVEPEQFIQLCRKVENGLCRDPKKVSKVLVAYLFKEGSEWNSDYLSQIGKISFVPVVSSLPTLSWIMAPCSPPHQLLIQSGTDGNTSSLDVTSLNKAVIYNRAYLIWTVKPVVKLPNVSHNGDLGEAHTERFLSALLVTTTPTAQDIIQNLINLSTSGLANRNLLSKYNPEFVVERGDKQKISIMQVFKKAFECLENQKAVTLLAQLQNLPCIPVSADSFTDDDMPSKVVLVKPIYVVAEMIGKDKALMPYINVVPNCMKPHMSCLKEIGVKKCVSLIHIKHLFKMLHQQNSDGGPVDPNQLSVIRYGLLKLKDILEDTDNSLEHTDNSKDEITQVLTPLYLPTKEDNQWCLKLSSELVFTNCSRYISNDVKNFDFLNTKYRLFQIPKEIIPSRYYRTRTLSHYGQTASEQSFKELLQQASEVSILLPESIRPRPLSLCTVEKKLPDGINSPEFIFFKASLLEMKRYLPQLEKILSEIFEKHVSDSAEASTQLMSILTHLKIHVIKGLKTQVCIEDNKVGTLNPNLILEKDIEEDHYNLYLSESVGTEEHIWQELSECILMELAVLLNKPSKGDMLALTPILTKCCRVQSKASLESFADQYGIGLSEDGRLEGTDSDELSEDDIEPIPGRTMPPVFVEMTAKCSINNIYRPEEWVGYEIGVDEDEDEDEAKVIMVWAIVIDMVECEDENCLKKYKILVEEQGFIVVDALDLHKIIHIDDTVDVIVDNDTKDIALCSPSTAIPPRDDINVLQNLKEAIDNDLTIVQRIPDEERKRKAVRLLLRKYHPDKAQRLEDQDAYEEAFKYLLAQKETIPFTNHFKAWTAQGAKRQPNYSRNYTKMKQTYDRFSQTQPSSEKAKCWLKQAEADCDAMQVIKTSMKETGSHVCQVMLLAHEVIEKSLKSGMYALFGLNPKNKAVNEDIRNNAERICTAKPAGRSLNRQEGGGKVSLVDIAIKVWPYFNSARYPTSGNVAPVDIHTQDDAEEAAEFAEIVIEFIQTTCLG